MVSLIQQGVVTNQRKNIDRGMSVFTFAMGQKDMYDYLNDNPSFLVGLSIMLTIRGSLRKMRMLSPLTLPYKSISLVPVTLNICLDTSTALQEGN